MHEDIIYEYMRTDEEFQEANSLENRDCTYGGRKDTRTSKWPNANANDEWRMAEWVQLQLTSLD